MRYRTAPGSSGCRSVAVAAPLASPCIITCIFLTSGFECDPLYCITCPGLCALRLKNGMVKASGEVTGSEPGI